MFTPELAATLRLVVMPAFLPRVRWTAWETVGEGFCARLCGGRASRLVSVRPHLPTHTVQVSVSAGLPRRAGVSGGCSRLFDLDRQPAQVAAAVLGPLGEDRPGLRLPGSVDTV